MFIFDVKNNLPENITDVPLISYIHREAIKEDKTLNKERTVINVYNSGLL